ncbi:MAG: hypothetical protein IKA54_02885 [Clostridia bacterium]|nr:hypothetical protein [Clostridia bacterium]
MENIDIMENEIEEVKLEEINVESMEEPSLVKDYFVKDGSASKTDLASLFGQSEMELQKEFGSYKAKKIYKRLNVFIDGSTLLKDEIVSKLKLATKYGFYGASVFLRHVALAKSYLRGSGVKVRALVGYPFGLDDYKTTKCALKQAVEKGADEVILQIPSYSVKNGELKELTKTVKKLQKYLRKKPLILSLDASTLSLSELESGVNALSVLDVSSINITMPSGIDKNIIENVVSSVAGRENVEYYSDICSAEDAVSVLLSGINVLTTPSCENVVLDLNKKINTAGCQATESVDKTRE